MKIHGKTYEPNETLIPFLKKGETIVMKARAVLDYSEFDQLCPRPNPPKRTYADGSIRDVLDDPTYIKAMDDYAEKRVNWMILTSINATDGLEWEKVNMKDPDTWNLLQQELKSAGFSEIEIGRLQAGVFEANGLDQEKLDQALKDFLAGQGQTPQA